MTEAALRSQVHPSETFVAACPMRERSSECS